MPSTRPSWVRDAVFYQVFPDRFAASDRVAEARPARAVGRAADQPRLQGRRPARASRSACDYLADLGVNALYLTPIFQSASNHRYHTYDYLPVDPLLGGDAALRELLDEAHARGIRVVLDGVFNHTGRGFWPFHHVLENGAGSPYRDWFHFDQAALDGRRPVRRLPVGRPTRRRRPTSPSPGRPTTAPATSRVRAPRLPRRGGACPRCRSSTSPNPAVREYLLARRRALAPLRHRRLAPGRARRRSTTAPFWQEFRRRCRAVNPEAYLVGEIWHVAPEWLAGDRFDALMNYPLAEAIIGFVGGPSLNEALRPRATTSTGARCTGATARRSRPSSSG